MAPRKDPEMLFGACKTEIDICMAECSCSSVCVNVCVGVSVSVSASMSCLFSVNALQQQGWQQQQDERQPA